MGHMAPEGARPRRQPPDVRRDQLLDAAEEVLMTKGLAATTVADVAEEAGLAKGTVYLHFASKDELLAGLRARHLQRFAEALGPPEPDGRAAVEQLDHFVDRLFAFSFAHSYLHHVLFHEAGMSEEDAFAGARDRLAAIVAEGVGSGELTAPDPRVAADFVLHGMHGVLVHALHGPVSARRPSTDAARALARAALGLAPAQSPGPSRP